ncbi:hypothetical protein D041_4028B, partial [Vibrio parahaemolyticus EKP-008]
SPKPV